MASCNVAAAVAAVRATALAAAVVAVHAAASAVAVHAAAATAGSATALTAVALLLLSCSPAAVTVNGADAPPARYTLSLYPLHVPETCMGHHIEHTDRSHHRISAFNLPCVAFLPLDIALKQPLLLQQLLQTSGMCTSHATAWHKLLTAHALIRIVL